MRRAPLRPHPLATGSPAGTPLAEGPDGGDRPLVLVVGRDPERREAIRARATPEYRVAEAASVADGLHAAAQLAPDLIVSDGTVSDSEAVWMLAALRDAPDTQATPVLLLSGTEADALPLTADLGRLLADGEPALAYRGGAASLEPDPADVAFLDALDAAILRQMGDVAFGTAPLAGTLGVSPRQLRRQLVAAVGESPAQRIRRTRTLAAAEMLTQGTSVKETSYAVGYRSESGFRSAFRRAFGLTPSAYLAAGGAGEDATARTGG